MNHKIRTELAMNEKELNDILEEEFENGYELISVGFGDAGYDTGTVILFKKTIN